MSKKHGLFKDLSGQTFGNWTVLCPSERKRRFICQCKCGSKVEVLNYHLVSGASTKCRSCYGRNPIVPQIGDKVGSITIVASKIENGSTKVECSCECGNLLGWMNIGTFNSGRITKCKKCSIEKQYRAYEDISHWYWKSIVNRAIKKNIEIGLTIEDIWNIYLAQNKVCAISRIPIKFVRKASSGCKEQTASIDRIDSNKGYVKGNVQIVHKRINFMKHNLPQEEFIALCNLIAKNNKRDIDEKYFQSNTAINH